MKIEEFNALPIAARLFIENNAGCLSCGNKEQKLTKAYELYKTQKIMKVYQLFGGAVNYSQEGKRGVLTSLNDTDTDQEKRNKIEIAKLIYAAEPHLFMVFNEVEIDEVLEGLEPEIEVDLDAIKVAAEAAELKAAEAAELKAAEEIKAKENEILDEPISKSKK